MISVNKFKKQQIKKRIKQDFKNGEKYVNLFIEEKDLEDVVATLKRVGYHTFHAGTRVADSKEVLTVTQ